jgi:hypothetical protein
MKTHGPRRTRRLLIAAALSVAITAAGAASAQAGLLSGLVVESAPSCAPQPLSQPFRSFGDTAHYTLLPRGTFESGTRGWTLSNARVVSGNESFYVNARGDSKSLSISRGGSATSPTICVGLEHPTMRFFARSSGVLPALGVSVIVRTSLGLKLPVPLGVVTPGSSWRPTQRFIVLANLLPLLPGNYTPVSFRFNAVSGSWWIDDVYVDPKKH